MTLGHTSRVTDTEVLVAGAGPVGLTAAIELARRDVAVRIIDPLPEPPQYAKAVGVQPRTLEVFERMGILRQILDAAVHFRGQIVYVNGERGGQGSIGRKGVRLEPTPGQRQVSSTRSCSHRRGSLP